MSEASKIVDSLVSSSDFRDLMRTIVAEVVNDTLVKRLEICEGELHEARCEIDALKVTLEGSTDNTSVLAEKLDVAQKELHDLQQYSRRNNLRIAGVPETPGEDTSRIVKAFAQEKLNMELNDWDIDRSHRVG